MVRNFRWHHCLLVLSYLNCYDLCTFLLLYPDDLQTTPYSSHITHNKQTSLLSICFLRADYPFSLSPSPPSYRVFCTSGYLDYFLLHPTNASQYRTALTLTPFPPFFIHELTRMQSPSPVFYLTQSKEMLWYVLCLSLLLVVLLCGCGCGCGCWVTGSGGLVRCRGPRTCSSSLPLLALCFLGLPVSAVEGRGIQGWLEWDLGYAFLHHS